MHYSSTWLILKNKKVNNVTSSTRSHRPKGCQRTQKLRQLLLQCGFLPLIRVRAQDRLKFLKPLLDRRFIHANNWRSSKVKSGRCPARLTIIRIGIVRIKASWTASGWLPWTHNLKEEIRWVQQTQRIAHRSYWSFFEDQCWPPWEENNKMPSSPFLPRRTRSTASDCSNAHQKRRGVKSGMTIVKAPWQSCSNMHFRRGAIRTNGGNTYKLWSEGSDCAKTLIPLELGVAQGVKWGKHRPFPSRWQLLSKDIRSKVWGPKRRSTGSQALSDNIQLISVTFLEGKSAGFSLEGT